MASAGFSAWQGSEQASYQSKVAERNAKLESEAANQAKIATREEALAHYRQVGQLKGQQQAAMAASGIDTNFGTSQDIKETTDYLAREDAGRIYKQGASTMRGFDIRSANYRGEAAAQRAAGTAALVSGAMQMGQSVLGGVKQYRDAKGTR